ncbi:MAG: DUF5615 family PIN-like protein [Spirulina sp.]
MDFAIAEKRTVLTRNRRHCIRFHFSTESNHEGIIVCTEDSDFAGVASRIDEAIAREETLQGKLIRVNRLSQSDRTSSFLVFGLEKKRCDRSVRKNAMVNYRIEFEIQEI